MRTHIREYGVWILAGIVAVAAHASFLAPLALAQEGRGATLSLGPSTGVFTVGSTFTVSFYLNTGGESVNAIEAYLNFPPEKLQVVSPSTGKSFIEVWADQPVYSNKNGTITFLGGLRPPGINTGSGIISTITFRVKDTGTAVVKVLDTAKVFAADGLGTNILNRTTGGLYTLVLPPPAGPAVVSPTHPDQEKWGGVKNAVFRWETAPDAEGYSYVLNNSAVDEPDTISEGVRGSAAYDGLADGTHYFHIKSLRAGTWGGRHPLPD